MSNKKQTAVEWLYEQMFLSPKSIIEYRNILEQAKAMEKEQHQASYNEGYITAHLEINHKETYEHTTK